MRVRWITAMVDVPDRARAATDRFWAGITGCTPGARSSLDQICIDADPTVYREEIQLW